MAEAIINNSDRQWIAYSAGTRPAGFVHPIALQVLREIGIDHQGESKSIDDVKDIQFDLVITVCDSAEKECPVWLGNGKRHHIGFPDPAQVIGSNLEILNAFRSVRDGILINISPVLDEYIG